MTVNWGRVPSHTLRCVGLLWVVAMGTEFLSPHLQIGTRRIKPSSFFPPLLHGMKMTLHLLYRKVCQRSSCSPLIVDLWIKPCLVGSEDVCVGCRVKDEGEKTASKRLRERMAEMPGTGSLAATSLQPLLDRAVWAEASWFYCLMVWSCLACEGSYKQLMSAQLWKWAASPVGRPWYKTDCPLEADSGEPPLDFRNAYHGLQSGLVVFESNIRTWKYVGGLETFWRLYENAGWLQRSGVISFLLHMSVLLGGNSLLHLVLFCVCVHGSISFSMLKTSVSVFRICDHVVYPKKVISQDDVYLWIKFWDFVMHWTWI